MNRRVCRLTLPHYYLLLLQWLICCLIFVLPSLSLPPPTPSPLCSCLPSYHTIQQLSFNSFYLCLRIHVISDIIILQAFFLTQINGTTIAVIYLHTIQATKTFFLKKYEFFFRLLQFLPPPLSPPSCCSVFCIFNSPPLHLLFIF